jgi:hypothetical protein
MSASIDSQKLPKTPEEFRTLLGSDESWFVRSAQDLEELLESSSSPLANVPDDALEEFKQSLIFKNGGLAHADYGSLVEHVTFKQFEKLWEHFGLSPLLFHQDNHKTCVGSHICDNKQWSYCGPDC